MSKSDSEILGKINQYANIKISADISHLSDNHQKMLKILVEAGKLADKIFWHQSAIDAIAVRDSLTNLNTPEAKDYLTYVNINYGPYDPLNDNKRFVGIGPEERPKVGGFYPQDMTKEEFENFIKSDPKLAESLKSQYTVVTRENGKLNPIPYSTYYKESEELANLLSEAAELCDNPSFKKYLVERAKSIRTNDYFPSDLAWMDVENSDVDIVIGPIENYQDELFNYKAAYEAVVMVKDDIASKELEVYKQNMQNFESSLPIDNKYKQKELNEGNKIQVVNVVYFGGDCQQAVKTIAAALPNDPKVAEKKGRKLSMYKNFMEAKFDVIVNPIGKILLDDKSAQLVDKKAFTSFVTLHEVSHALGPKYVYGTKTEIREALKDKYSGIEECKADILSMYNHLHLLNSGYYNQEYIEKAKATYLAGLYRSIRFGTGAHATANYIQLNFLKDKKAIIKDNSGKLTIDDKLFFDTVKELAAKILEIQYTGSYEAASDMINKYGQITPDIQKEIELLNKIPRDINTSYEF
ncbi:MAG TPA: peptidase [Candidatus Kapabacteria bacterium]|nr:peptidase [Candidatus Kapabacteria bacterium]